MGGSDQLHPGRVSPATCLAFSCVRCLAVYRFPSVAAILVATGFNAGAIVDLQDDARAETDTGLTSAQQQAISDSGDGTSDDKQTSDKLIPETSS